MLSHLVVNAMMLVTCIGSQEKLGPAARLKMPAKAVFRNSRGTARTVMPVCHPPF